MQKERNKISLKFICGVIVFVVCVLYSGIMSFKSAPITEGWYTEYAWLINNGKLPYKDFEYLFLPLYMFIISGFTKIFGYSLFALRIFGILIFAGIGCALYLVYSKLFNEFVAIFTSFVSILFMQSENAQIFYDYIRVHDLFAILTVLALLGLSERIIHKKQCIEIPYILKNFIFFIGVITSIASIIYIRYGKKVFVFAVVACFFMYFFVKDIVKKETYKYSLISFFTGIFVSCELLIKQSNGTLMLVFIIIYMLVAFAVSCDKCFLKELMGIISGVTVVFSALIIYLIITNSFLECITCCFGNAISAKGGVVNTLFSWIPECLFIFEKKLYLVALIIIVGYVLFENFKNKPQLKKRNLKFLLLVTFVFLTLIIYFNTYVKDFYKLNSQLYDPTFAHVSFFIVLGVFLCLAVYVISKKDNYEDIVRNHDKIILFIPTLGTAIAQGYGCAMSGGLSTGNTYLCFGLMIGILLWMAYESKNLILEMMLILTITVYSSVFIACKANQMYYWWYLESGTIAEQNETADVPLMQGIKMNMKDKVCYETVYNDIINNTEVGDNIYVFPNAPIFYTVSNRHSITYSKVEWFDVSSESAIENDIQLLRDNNPKMIVYVSVPEAAYDAHESMFNSYQTRKMRDFLLNELIASGKYSIVSNLEIGQEYYVQTYVINR